MQTQREGAARNALGALSPEFKELIGAGLSVLLEEQGLTEADVEEWQTASPTKADVASAARGALGDRIAKNYPDWDDVKIDKYIRKGMGEKKAMPAHGMPVGVFPPAESLSPVSPAESERSTKQPTPTTPPSSVVPDETKERMKRMREIYGLEPEE
ncbi:MAG TPA: hypothetical protein EYN66_18160 [Myxococcales bacterium]|nr:hypothetical protein [Myxococcales bacterium]